MWLFESRATQHVTSSIQFIRYYEEFGLADVKQACSPMCGMF